MARSLVSVWLLRAQLVARSPLAVGGLDGNSDLPVARNGLGKPYLPGTTLGGVMRTLFMRSLDELGLMRQPRRGRLDVDPPSRSDSLFGWSAGSGDGGEASFLRVHDAVLDDARIELRDGILMDRESGSAADNYLYSREVVAAGARATLLVEVEVPAELVMNGREVGETVTRVNDALSGLARLLQDEGLRVGAASGRGLGVLEVVGPIELVKLDLGQIGHVAAWWRWRASGVFPDAAVVTRAPLAEARPDEDRWTVTVHWKPAGPILVKARAEGDKVQQLPLVGHDGKGWRAVLPGSSIRGALRSHAERIVRTLLLPVEIESDPKDQLKVRVVLDLFGRVRDGKEQKNARGALSVADCRHDAVLAHPPDGQTEKAPVDDWHVRTRIAIDRWTGGAMNTALFKLLEPAWEDEETPWDPIVIEVDLHRLEPGDTKHAAMALLWLVLRDLQSGLIPLGFGTNRGMGAIEVKRVEWRHGATSLPPDGATLDQWQAAWLSNLGGAI